MGGLRKEIDLCSKEEDVCGFVGMVGMVGFDETHGKWSIVSRLYKLDVGGLRKEIYSEEGDMVGIVRCFAVGRARRGRRWSDLRFGGSS